MTAITRNSTSNAPFAFSSWNVTDCTCSFLPNSDLESMNRVSRVWCKSVIDEEKKRLQQYVRESGFGAKKWEKYFGNVEPVKLPLSLFRELTGFRSNRSFNPDLPEDPLLNPKFETIGESHFLFLMPKSVNGEPLTVSRMMELAGEPKEGDSCRIHDITFGEVSETPYRDKRVDESYWILIPLKGILIEPEKGFKRIFLPPEYKLPPGYKLPKVQEAIIAVLTRYFDKGDFNDTFDYHSEIVCKDEYSFVGFEGDISWERASVQAIDRSLPGNYLTITRRIYISPSMVDCVRPVKRFYGPDHKEKTGCIVA